MRAEGGLRAWRERGGGNGAVLGGAHLAGQSVLLGLGLLDEFQEVAGDLLERPFDVRGRDGEEFAAAVDEVDALVGEAAMQFGLDRHGVLGEEQRVDVEVEGDRGTGELADAVFGDQSARHANFDHFAPEGPDVGDDVDVTGSDVRGPEVDVFDLGVDVVDLRLDLPGLLGFPLGEECVDDVLVVPALLEELLALLFEFLSSFGLLAQPGFLLALDLLLDFDRVLVVQGELQLAEAQAVVFVGDAQIDHRPEPFHLLSGPLQPRDGRLSVPGFEGEDAVLRLGVVGPEHHLRHVRDELPPFGRRIVEGEIRRRQCGRPGPDHLLDA